LVFKGVAVGSEQYNMVELIQDEDVGHHGSLTDVLWYLSQPRQWHVSL